MKRWHIAFWIILIFGVGIWYSMRSYHPGPKEGSLAPNFSLPNNTGQNKSLQDYSGKVVLLNFWATWCGPCVSEMASLDMLYQKLKDKNFEVVAVSVDEGGWKDIDVFLKKHPVTFILLLDAEFKAAEQYGTYRVPESYLINSKGEIVEKISGAQEWASPAMVSKISKLLP